MEIFSNCMKLSKTQIRTIIVSFGVLISFGVYSALFIIIKNKNNHISALQNKVDIEVIKDQRLNSIKQLIKDSDKEFKQIDTYFVSEGGVVNFLEKLESLGPISGVSVSVNSVGVNENANGNLPYELLNIEFESRGAWSSIVKLISLLETFQFGITIERVQLELLPNSNYWQMNTSFNVLKLK